MTRNKEKQTIIGREMEMAELRRCMESDRSEFVIVYGRRRVGKTFLIENFFKGEFDFSFVGRNNQSKTKQLRAFAKSLKKYAAMPKQPVFNDWGDAFDALEEYIESLDEERKKVVFIDEMPWIDTPQSEFVEALEGFWNAWGARRNDVVLVASGSASSWMMDKLVENPGGLHARITNNIYVRPFTLKETEDYLVNRGFTWSRYQILQLYMAMGGIPFYLSLLDTSKTMVNNINHLFFRRNSELKTEFQELYSAIFSNSGKYLDIVKILYAHKQGMTYAEIQKASGISGSRLTIILKNLERCDFILSYSQFGNKSRGTIYRLVDFYTLFYMKFLDSVDSKDEEWWLHNFNTHSVISWQGVAFELVCLTHLLQIRRGLGIEGISTSASSWRYTPSKGAGEGDAGAQIDLVIDRGDHVINLCEMKFCTEEFVISADYEQRIRRRIQIFREKTKTRKALVSTFVTTFGVAKGVHNSIVQSELTMDALFL